MIRAALLLIVASLVAIAVRAQTPLRPVTASYMAGAGTSHVTDAYLSPFPTAGWAATFIYERSQALRSRPEQWSGLLAISLDLGRGHNDFSSPRPITFTPPEGHLLWTRPVVLLTNRSTYSAANYFAAFMRTLPQCTQVGATTGGGGGMPFSSSLPNGWTVRFSACPVLDPARRLTEDGVSPEPAHAVSFGPEASAAGSDPILDHAISLLLQ